jgi:hypothetical protein
VKKFEKEDKRMQKAIPIFLMHAVFGMERTFLPEMVNISERYIVSLESHGTYIFAETCLWNEVSAFW